MKGITGGWVLRWLFCSASLLFSARALAISESLPVGDDEVKLVLNNTLTSGGGIRMKSPSVHIIGKSNLDPNVCGTPAYQSCQGVFKDQTFPAAHLAAAPGAASVNADDGDLNYAKHQLFQAVVKSTQDLTITYKDFGFFGRTLFFYDFANDDKTEYHPNRITAENYQQVGLTNVVTPLGVPYPGGRVYGPGGVVRNKRTDGEILAESGTNLQYLDSYFYGKLPLWSDKTLTFKLGRQLVNWGESTTLVLNSINQANPINANNFTRIGSQVEEVFTPINQIFLSFEPIENTTVEGFYQLEWKNVEAFTPGTYFSTLDAGTNNTVNNVSSSFGGAAEDPDSKGALLYNPLALLTNTTTTINRIPDLEPRTSGQYGVKLAYYAEWLNGGTDLDAYYMHYHSRLPYVSFYSAYPSCARAAGNSAGNNATDLVSFLEDCPHTPLGEQLAGDPSPVADATSSVAALGSPKFQVSYPEDIDLLGLSFNTTVGAFSIQGEVAYRPNLPLQVDEQDLVFAAYGPTLTNCDQSTAGCSGNGETVGALANAAGLGTVGQTLSGALNGLGLNAAAPLPQVSYNQAGAQQVSLTANNDFTPANGATAPYHDNFNVIEGALPGAARAFPNFIIPYRGGTIGQNTPCFPAHGSAEDVASGLSTVTNHPYYAYTPSSPCYIKGYERYQVYQFNVSTTRILGASENPFAADQIVLVGELGAEFVPNLPHLDRLQFEADGTDYAASAGADGSGANGSRLACSTNADCDVNQPGTSGHTGDGLRFNPHQQDPTGYPDRLSYGYRLIGIFHYEGVLPGIGIQPTVYYAQDVAGTSPGPGGNFIAGRKQASILIETRYKSALSFDLGYTWYFGGGDYNLLADRDFAQFFVKYQF